MKNFEQAKKIIEEYRKLRLDREAKNAFKLHDKLKEIGYTPESFMEEEKEKYLKNIEIKEIDSSMVLEEVARAHKIEGDTCLILTQQNSAVYVGKDGYNEKYCEENNIHVYKIGYSGGTIVVSDKDLTLGIICNRDDLMPLFIEKLSKWIDGVKKTELKGNDITIDDYKIVGTARRITGNKCLYAIQISFKVDIDLIKNICLKEMKKTPKGLSDFGDKTKDDLIKEIKIWLQ